MTRSVYKIQKVDEEDIFGSDEFVRYGQKIKIVANEYLNSKELSLCSYRQSPTVCTANSNRQLVTVSSAPAKLDTMWVVDHIDPNVRFEM